MTEPKHTQGDWDLHPTVKEDPPLIYSDGLIVATVDTSAPEAGEREANAHLIAAAPQLLGLAEEVYRAGLAAKVSRRLMNQARSVIVKAGGEA